MMRSTAFVNASYSLECFIEHHAYNFVLTLADGRAMALQRSTTFFVNGSVRMLTL